MTSNKDGKTLVQFNVKNGVYAVAVDGEETATVKSLTYMNTFSKERAPQTKQIYGDGEVQDTLVTEKSVNGTLGVTARDKEFEIDLGFTEAMANGEGDVALSSFKRAHIGFETEVKEKGKVAKIKKVWVLNAEVMPANESLTQNQDDITPSTADYSYTAYGVNLKNSTGTSDYIDENGQTKKVFTLSCMPGEEGYDTFLDSVPVPKMKEQA